MSEKWTKGPWWVEIGEGEDDEGVFYVCHEETVSPDTTICAFEGENPQDGPNAKLIAVAPEMYEALSELHDIVNGIIEGDYQPDSFTLQPARLALKKARGEA
jgi:hypothetical protein